MKQGRVGAKYVITKELHVTELDRALARHDPSTAYTILCEVLPRGDAGRILLELIRTQHDWPKPEKTKIEYHQHLSPREMEVFRYAEKGMSIEQTARSIPISIETAKFHRKSVLRKLGAKNITEAVHIGRELGLFE